MKTIVSIFDMTLNTRKTQFTMKKFYSGGVVLEIQGFTEIIIKCPLIIH